MSLPFKAQSLLIREWRSRLFFCGAKTPLYFFQLAGFYRRESVTLKPNYVDIFKTVLSEKNKWISIS